jgi:antitoxin component of RelBE/YafQ-DinJ toxin-antitoxin module
MPARRAIMRIQLDSGVKHELDALCDKRGMTQIAVMSRLVRWFVKQDDIIQTAVLQTLSQESMSRLAKQLLKHLDVPGKGTGK